MIVFPSKQRCWQMVKIGIRWLSLAAVCLLSFLIREQSYTSESPVKLKTEQQTNNKMTKPGPRSVPETPPSLMSDRRGMSTSRRSPGDPNASPEPTRLNPSCYPKQSSGKNDTGHKGSYMDGKQPWSAWGPECFSPCWSGSPQPQEGVSVARGPGAVGQGPGFQASSIHGDRGPHTPGAGNCPG